MLSAYLLFSAKVVTLVLAVLVLLGGSVALLGRSRRVAQKGHVEVTDWGEEVRAMSAALDAAMVATPRQRRALRKASRRRDKADKADAQQPRRRVFVLDFAGDLQASAVNALRHEVTAVLTRAGTDDEIVVRVESAGGLVHAYGLAASQLDRITAAGIRLTVCVDKVAASGGYLLACVADRILAAPFAVLGSIGVVAQIPNLHRLLQRHDIDVELLTAGKYKRTLTVLGENTAEGREKFQRDLEATHALFKGYVAARRSQLDIEAVATGEVWLGTDALAQGLIDAVRTSDEYLAARAAEGAAIYQIAYRRTLSWRERVGLPAGPGAVQPAWAEGARLPRLPV
ncbi:MAG TPA: protease SohB [Porticoccaceae bacterium]|nr:protease SohB [Porticoccaceae bacterium]